MTKVCGGTVEKMLADKTDPTCGRKKKRKRRPEPFPFKKLITVYRKPSARLLLSTLEEMT